MGCDIHLHIEVKYRGKWELYSSPRVKRNYWLFEKMAGVRGEEENAIVPPKGFPDDASPLVQLSYKQWGETAHTPSWLNQKEIGELQEALIQEYGDDLDHDLEYDILHCYAFGNSFASYGHDEDSRVEDVEEFRFVFWFDN